MLYNPERHDAYISPDRQIVSNIRSAATKIHSILAREHTLIYKFR